MTSRTSIAENSRNIFANINRYLFKDLFSDSIVNLV